MWRCVCARKLLLLLMVVVVVMMLQAAINAERAELSRASRDVLELRRQVEALNDKLLVARVEGRTEKVGQGGAAACWCVRVEVCGELWA